MIGAIPLNTRPTLPTSIADTTFLLSFVFTILCLNELRLSPYLSSFQLLTKESMFLV